MKRCLLVDIGNSRIKWAVQHDEALTVGEPIERVDREYQYKSAWNEVEPPSRVLVSNVLGESVAQEITRWCSDRWALPPEFVRSMATGFGVENGYVNPERLGVDRWVALVAARAICQDAVCVADVGTAITVDILDAAGRHHGGVIAPGVKLMQDALIYGTHALERGEWVSADYFGRDTETGIQNGSLAAAAGLIEKLVVEADAALQCQSTLVLCGGGAELVASRLRISCVLIPDLVLRGLAIICTKTHSRC